MTPPAREPRARPSFRIGTVGVASAALLALAGCLPGDGVADATEAVVLNTCDSSVLAATVRNGDGFITNEWAKISGAHVDSGRTGTSGFRIAEPVEGGFLLWVSKPGTELLGDPVLVPISDVPYDAVAKRYVVSIPAGACP